MNSDKKNLKVILIGFGIILAVAALIFFKSEIKRKGIEKKTNLETKKTLEEIKSAKSISAAELSKRILNREKLEIIDLRSNESFTQKHLANSINTSLENLINNLDKLDKNASYVLIDDPGSLEIMNLVGSEMRKKEIVNAYYLEGGFQGWVNNYYPTISDGDPNSAADQTKMKYVTSDQLNDILKKEKSLFIIDIRDRVSYDAGRIPGAKNIPLEELEKNIQQIPYVRRIIVYDNGTVSAFKAAVRLFDLGKFNVFTLSDGFPKWKEKNYPIEKL